MYDDWRPTPGQLALIDVPPGDDRLTGLVQSGGVRPVIDVGTTPRLPAPECEVRVSFFAPDALYRLDATAMASGGNGLVDLDVHRVERVQRRAHGRTRAALPVMVGDGPDGVAGTTTDVAPGGMGLRTDTPVPAGEPKIAVTLPDGVTVVALARILEAIQHDGQYRYRVAFSDIDERDRDLLIDLTRDR